jgi:hypothetical protein
MRVRVALIMFAQYDCSVPSFIMATLAIRIDEHPKKRAVRKAAKLRIPLTLVVINALEHFMESSEIIIGEPETVDVTSALQQKMSSKF